jgi:FKBP-type peptidyl-prolyl cis-trans isomerase FklB
MMKKTALCTLVLATTVSAYAPAEEPPKLDTDRQKLSYAIGVQVAQSLVQQGVDLDTKAFAAAIEDVIAGRPPQIQREEFEALLKQQQEEIKKVRDQKARENDAAGKAFLEKNKTKEGVRELPSGLQYRVIAEGGGAQPKAVDTVSVHYRGTLINGREFDSSARTGQPATFKVNGVISGWQEALPLMREGAKWQVFIPPALAYGERGAGSAIGPNETLIFDIELLKVVPTADE